MGVADNIKKIFAYGKKKNLERRVENEAIRASIEEGTFYSEYSSFTVGLQEMLDKLLETYGYQKVVYKPTRPEMAKYFKAAMEDPQFEPNYVMEKTVGGEFSFRLKTMSELTEVSDVAIMEDLH